MYAHNASELHKRSDGGARRRGGDNGNDDDDAEPNGTLPIPINGATASSFSAHDKHATRHMLMKWVQDLQKQQQQQQQHHNQKQRGCDKTLAGSFGGGDFVANLSGVELPSSLSMVPRHLRSDDCALDTKDDEGEDKATTLDTSEERLSSSSSSSTSSLIFELSFDELSIYKFVADNLTNVARSCTTQTNKAIDLQRSNSSTNSGNMRPPLST